MINPKILFSPFIPPDFRPLLSFVTPNALNVIEWKKVLAFAPTLAKRMATGEGRKDLTPLVQKLAPKNIVITNDPNDFNAGTPSLSPPLGSSILSLYFAQLKCNDGVFLDLRPSRFRLSKDGQILWAPNGLWVRFDPEFRNGMLSVYEGYYLNQPELLREGLKKIGLVKDHFTDEAALEVENILLGHIGGDVTHQKFKVAHFMQSFEKVFQFLIKQKIQLPPDFLYLGIYLGSLYIHLEELGESYDVRSAFLGVKSAADTPAS